MDANSGLIENKVAADHSQEDAVVIPRAIENHGVIGDLATIALVATDGTIDFLCWPDFDSPTIFAALLDPQRGGKFQIAPELADARVTQQYLPDTNVLLTRWMGDKVSGELTDFMYVKDKRSDGSSMVVRRFRATRGSLKVRMSCAPRFEYARRQLPAELEDGAAIWRQANGEVLRLLADVPLVEIDGAVVAEITLQAGECIDFILDDGDDNAAASTSEEMEEQTVAFWQNWARQSTYRGRWREMVNRSALALKLMTSRKHGSIVAAATFGLPETPGGSRNWDYRATWIRDASFTVYALMRLGYRDEAMAFNDWIGQRASACDVGGRLKIMYAIDGGEVPNEASLEHLHGYGGATPVRVGNNAAEQFQLDIYGELLDSIYLSNKYGHAISHDHWEGVRKVVEFVCDHWEDPDAGIWEMRREPQEFLHSRLMCWVAVDRGIRLATKRSLAAPFSKWHDVRNDIYEDIWKNFWNDEKGYFVQTRGGDTLDASLLLMPLVRFVSATDPRWLSTLTAIGDQLADDGVVHRYRSNDGLDGEEGAFSACSFWYAECLARAGDTKKARRVFESVLNYANHLGLYAEEFDTKAQLAGNFPQAFTHLALISAAFYLDRELDDRNSQEWRP
ncbi:MULTISPECIES: glycoside hydrolase family 15 protein [Rhizobium]|uniref:GH15 family glucan-1,4-alpha-glucosidase n=1 Tax=Rhizobium esperanzae TaxID=1967781 RepID=A0A7W6UNA5_9HYPH|nr:MULTISPECIES: glycoside hydrolase family 15 protein [Rhizobium]MBB4440162.1 GH15 family glucan-1,4-alpha-glucosidase [Rhizobium esperanzae]MDH6202273.1 GH15 family glucan-1,4-alpha-glucosidase [Rhizobium leguminosarum]